MAARQAKIMMAQFKSATKEPNEFIKFAMSEDDTNVWYILISGVAGNEDEYATGEYLCKMVAPKDFPYSPPEFYMMTKNGLYDINRKVCISIGEFHKDQYRASLGMCGFANQLVSGLIGWKELGSGISIVKTSTEDKKTIAKQSKDYNSKKHPEIMQLIETSFNQYSSSWTK
jgi:ubiquitin-conjugating enzyme E2 J2